MDRWDDAPADDDCEDFCEACGMQLGPEDREDGFCGECGAAV